MEETFWLALQSLYLKQCLQREDIDQEQIWLLDVVFNTGSQLEARL